MRFFSLLFMVLISLSIQDGYVPGASIGDAGICWVITFAYLGWCFEVGGKNK